MSEKIGIDLGDKYIKIAVLKHQADIFNIKYSKTYPVIDKTSNKDYFAYVKHCLKKFTKEFHIRSASLNFTLPVNPSESGCNFLTMPAVNKKILSKSVRYEIEEKSIVDNVNSFYDNWAVIDKEEGTSEQNLLIELIKIELIEMLSKINGFTWRLESIELQVITIGRIVHGNSIVIDFGHNATRIYAYRDGKPFAVEIIPIGGKNLEDLIERDYPNIKGNAAEIENFKKQCYLHNEFLMEEEDPLSDFSVKIADLASMMSLEIKRQVRNIELKKDYFVENVYFTGGLSDLKYLKEMISKDLDMVLLPLKLISETNGEELQGSNPYTLAGAASLFGRYKYFNEMNFANLANFSVDFSSIFTLVLCGALAIGIGTYLIHEMYNKQINSYNQSISEQNNTIASLQAQIDNCNSNVSSAQQTIDKVNLFTQSGTDLSKALYILSDITPQEISIQEAQIDDGVITLIGLSKDYSNIGFFAIALEKYGSLNIDYVNNNIEGEKYSNNNSLMKYGYKFTFMPNPDFFNYTIQNPTVDPTAFPTDTITPAPEVFPPDVEGDGSGVNNGDGTSGAGQGQEQEKDMDGPPDNYQ